MHLIYANPYWCVYRILSVPTDAVNQVPYMNRGWCVFETCIAGVGARQLLTVKDGKVLGMHNWLNIYMEERAGRLNYKGCIKPRRRGNNPLKYPAENGNLSVCQQRAGRASTS